MEKVTLTMKELKRAEVVQKTVSQKITVMEAAELLGISERQAYRLKGSFKLKGVKGLIHGNRGKVSPRRLDNEISEKIVKLAKGEYEGYNDSFFTERLGEEWEYWGNIGVAPKLYISASFSFTSLQSVSFRLDPVFLCFSFTYHNCHFYKYDSRFIVYKSKSKPMQKRKTQRSASII